MKKEINTFADYMEDESRVSQYEKEQINFHAMLITKIIEAREQKGWSQRDLAAQCGVKQPVIARMERMKTSPQIDTLFKILEPLGYTLSITPISKNN